MLWQFIAWYIQNSARQPLWENGTMRAQASEISMWCCSKNTNMLVILCLLDVKLTALTCWHSRNKMSHFVLHNSYCSSWPMKWPAAHFCTVLLTCCVAAWTDCWQCDSVQKYCCTATGGGFVNWFKSNCSQISSPLPPAYHCHHHHHHHHHYIFSRSTNCIAERQNMWKPTLHYIYYIYFSTFMIISHIALPKIRNVSDKIYLEIQNTHFMFSNFFFWKLCHLWDNVEQ